MSSGLDQSPQGEPLDSTAVVNTVLIIWGEDKTMSWEITGNSGTNPAINFLGTTDSQPLVIRAGGIEAMRIDQTGVEVAGMFD
jgi:hypothetical protein